mgnify:CR=1 FL=1
MRPLSLDCIHSERLDRSLAEGQAKKEACAINQSLSALGDVFSSLSSKSSHVPYRNTKLTYLLQVRRPQLHPPPATHNVLAWHAPTSCVPNFTSPSLCFAMVPAVLLLAVRS